MDVNFSTILEGTRQYFQGLPKGPDKDGKQSLPEEMTSSNGNGGPSPETGSPPSAAHPQDPLEPEPHIIHKPTVMQQAQRQQAQAQARLERPSSVNLISPPPHIIRKPQPAIPEESRPRYASHIPTPPAPARYSPHIPAQPPPTPSYQSRAQPQRSLTVLEPRRPSPVQSLPRSSSYVDDPHQRHAEEQSRQGPHVSKDSQDSHPQRQYEPTPAPAISQDQRHVTSVPNHYLEHRKSSPLTAQHSPVMRSTHPNPTAYPGYHNPPQSSVDTSSRSVGDSEIHGSTTRTYPTLQPHSRSGASIKSYHYQDSGQQAAIYTNHKMIHQSSQPPPASYQRTRELYNSQVNHKTPTTLSQLPPRSSKHQEYSYSGSRMSQNKAQSSHPPTAPNNYQERVPALSVDQRQAYSNMHSSTLSSSKPSHSSHAHNMGQNVHQNMIRSSSGSMDMTDHQRVPPIHPHHHLPSRGPIDYPPHHSKGLLHTNHQYSNDQYHQSSVPSNISGSSSYNKLQNYPSSAKSSSNLSPKHIPQSRSVASKQNMPHQQRMTVSVTSLVNQMKQVQPDPSSSTTHNKNKKESPLDLSVKTVRIPADSTAKDEVESGFDKRDGIIMHSGVHNSREGIPLGHPRHMYQDKQQNAGGSSHKVDFIPNFSAGSGGPDKNVEYREQSHSYLPNRQINPYDRNYPKQPDPRSHLPKTGSQPDPRNYNHQYESSKHLAYSNSHYSRTIDSSLPKIDLTINIDDNDKERTNHGHVYSKEITRRIEEESRKRDASHIANHVPPKVARYESWDIDRHGRIDPQHHHKESTSRTNHYFGNGGNVHNQSHQKPYEYNHSYRKSENVESHSSRYNQHPNPNTSRPQNDLYYPHGGMQKHNTNHYNYTNTHDKGYPTNHDALPLGNHYSHPKMAPADKRVLSILRNSLGAKNTEIQKTADSDDCIIIQDDNEPPSIDLTEYRPKKARYVSESKTITVSQSQDISSNSLSYKMHVPRAVDSIKYDSDSSQKSLKEREDISPSIPIKTETATYTVPINDQQSVQVEIDIAARIRTKAELKGFSQPSSASDGDVAASDTKKDNVSVLTVIKNDLVPPQVHRRRLFSRDNNDDSKKDTPVIRNSSESRIFDFPGSDSEGEAPVLDKRPINSGKENISENVNVPNVEDERIVNIKCEKDIEDDPIWAETCNSFLEELESGKVKKNKRRKILPTSHNEDYDNNNEIAQCDIKIEKTVIVSVDVNNENSCPLITKIKEEIVDTFEEVAYDSDSSDENVPLIQKIKKEHSNPTFNNTSDAALKCPVIKLEKNLNLMNSVKTTVKVNAMKTYSFENNSNCDDDKVSSDDERLIVKKRKQEMLKNNKEKSDSSDSDSEVISRLRNRKNLSNKSENIKSSKTPVNDDVKVNEDTNLKKPGFGDGSGFRPGWETEVYNYKRSLRMPARLIHVSRPPHWPRVSTSLPDLDPCPNSPAPSTSTEELFTHKKFSNVIYDSNEKIKQEIDSDLESLSSYAVPKTNYDSEASSSTVVSSKGTKKDGSILDVLIQKCGNKDLKKRKQKELDNGPKLIPKSDNPVELLGTPCLDKTSNRKGNKNASKDKVMEDLFASESFPFRKQTVSTFRDAFISKTDGVLGATEEFAPVVLKTRTRKEARVLKKRTTMKEVFGDERPASAPPVACTEGDHIEDVKDEKLKQNIKVKEELKKSDSKCKEDVKKKDENKLGDCLKSKEDSKGLVKKVKKNLFNSTVRDRLRSSQLSKKNDATGRMLRRKKRNNLMKAMAKSKKIKKTSESINCQKIKKESSTVEICERTEDSIKIKKEPIDGEEPVKKKFKKLFNRRKLSSGFDYIRKKKKLMKKEGVLKKRCIIPRPNPESVQDIQKEIKNWIIQKSIGETVLHRAAKLGYIDCVAYCLEKLNVPPSCRDNAGYTPLHEACSKGHLDIARLLLQYGADVSEAAQGGIRPLHEACDNGYIEIIRLLLSYGADPLLATYSGQSPISLSSGSCVRFLQLHLSDVQGNVPQPWHFNGPCKLLDPVDSGYDPLANPPPSPTPPPSPPQDFVCSLVPHPPLYRLRPSSPTQPPDPTLWCLLQDLASILQVKSRDALLKQVHCGPGVPRDSLKELKMQEFLDRAQCQQFLAAGEKINIRASKIALVRYTDKVKQLLSIESVTVR